MGWPALQWGTAGSPGGYSGGCSAGCPGANGASGHQLVVSSHLLQAPLQPRLLRLLQEQIHPGNVFWKILIEQLCHFDNETHFPIVTCAMESNQNIFSVWHPCKNQVAQNVSRAYQIPKWLGLGKGERAFLKMDRNQDLRWDLLSARCTCPRALRHQPTVVSTVSIFQPELVNEFDQWL